MASAGTCRSRACLRPESSGLEADDVSTREHTLLSIEVHGGGTALLQCAGQLPEEPGGLPSARAQRPSKSRDTADEHWPWRRRNGDERNRDARLGKTVQLPPGAAGRI